MSVSAFEAALAQAKRDRRPVMALRHDGDVLDDVVVEVPKLFRAEMMSEKELWLCCFFANDERVTFFVRACKGRRLSFEVTEEPSDWLDWDSLPPPLGVDAA